MIHRLWRRLWRWLRQEPVPPRPAEPLPVLRPRLIVDLGRAGEGRQPVAGLPQRDDVVLTPGLQLPLEPGLLVGHGINLRVLRSITEKVDRGEPLSGYERSLLSHRPGLTTGALDRQLRTLGLAEEERRSRPPIGHQSQTYDLYLDPGPLPPGDYPILDSDGTVLGTGRIEPDPGADPGC